MNYKSQIELVTKSTISDFKVKIWCVSLEKFCFYRPQLVLSTFIQHNWRKKFVFNYEAMKALFIIKQNKKFYA